MNNNKDYYIGLDMGTNSVGWAVTDTEYNLIRKKGKDLWGVRLFKAANTAAERRINRTNRRRLQREKNRIMILRSFFDAEIRKIDPNFFERLDDSFFHLDDKKIKTPFVLFADNGYTDKEYYKEYPTIFHLRKNLIINNCTHDIRLVFIALLNMFHHRGHFLYDNILSEESSVSNEENINKLISMIEDIFEIKINVSNEEIIKNIEVTEVSRSEKKEKILRVLSKDLSKDKIALINEMAKFIAGLKGSVKKLFFYNEKESNNENDDIKDFSFEDSDYKESIIKIQPVLSEDQYNFIELLKNIHDNALLVDILRGEEYLSFARVKMYEKHKKDLKLLKKKIKEVNINEYNDFFRYNSDYSYSAYVGSVNSSSKAGKERRNSKKSREKVYDRIKEILKIDKIKKVEDIKDDDLKYIFENIKNDDFLPKQLSNLNGVIPYQVHLKEMKKILDNAKTYLRFLNEKDETGLTISEKIIELFKFRIPYYVGPLVNVNTDEKSIGNAWSVRKESGKVFPWNFNDKIDVKASAEKFITKMTNMCTYFSNEPVLPKNSLLYEKFMLLNELNNLKINGICISSELKLNLIQDLFKKGKKVTNKKLCDYIRKNENIDGEIDIKGIDNDFKNTLSNYAFFLEVFDKDELTDNEKEICEDIIFKSTIYGDSKRFIKDYIKEKYIDVFTDKQINRICGKKFIGWGKLSAKLLKLIGADKETREEKSIIKRMETENYNLMELIGGNSKFTYYEQIEKEQEKLDKNIMNITLEDLDSLYLSPSVRRMVWQTILICRELRQVMGYDPKKIFIEMARGGELNKERKDSRLKKVRLLYDDKSIKFDDKDEIKESLLSKNENDLRIQKMYLYYMQQGKSMYSGKKIDFDRLFTTDYDIDHIIPRSIKKDDSIENNKVLVLKNENMDKADIYPLKSNIRESMFLFWKILHDKGFINDIKFSRLIRKEELTEKERADFINRQLVETRQGTKAIANLFKESFKNTKIVYSKALLTHDFRNKYDLVKCRDINDFHHANDAYLNIVVGNVFNTKYTDNPYRFIHEEYMKDRHLLSLNMDKLFNNNVVRGNDCAWVVDSNVNKRKSIDIVKCTMSKNSPLVTNMSFEAKGEFSDSKPISHRKVNENNYIPVKVNSERLKDISKYGGKTKVKGAYFFAVESEKKGKKIITIEFIPIYLKSKIKDTNDLIEYSKNMLDLINPKILIAKIKMQSLIRVNGFNLYLTGRKPNRLIVSNAEQIKINDDANYYCKLIYDNINNDNIADKNNERYNITKEKNLKLYDILVKKHKEGLYKNSPTPFGNKLSSAREKFIKLDIKAQIKILTEVLKLSSRNNQGVNLKLIGESDGAGETTINKNITKCNEFVIINKSVTGIYEKCIDVLKL